MFKTVLVNTNGDLDNLILFLSELNMSGELPTIIDSLLTILEEAIKLKNTAEDVIIKCLSQIVFSSGVPSDNENELIDILITLVPRITVIISDLLKNGTHTVIVEKVNKNLITLKVK